MKFSPRRIQILRRQPSSRPARSRPALSRPALWRPVALAVAAVGIAGCDPVAPSNKDVLSGIRDGIAKLGKADGYKPRDVVQAAHQSFIAAAGEKNAGPGYQAIASSSVAALDQGVGQSHFSTFFANVIAARQTLADLRQQSAQVTLNVTMAAGHKKVDPRDVQTKVAEQIRLMQGGPQSQTWGGAGASLPALAAIKQEISRLQGVVSEQQAKVADLTKQRSDAIATSETQLKHADSLKGDEAVRAFADGSETRRRADDLAIQIDLEGDKLRRGQSDLAIAQGQEAAVNGGIAQLTGQAKQLDSAWAEAQTRAANQMKIATASADGTADDQSAPSIKALSAKLAQQLGEVQATRAAAVEQFAEADKFFGTAQGQAQTLIKDYAEKISSPAKDAKNYASLKQTMLPAQFTLQMGVVRRDAGSLIAAEAALLAEVNATKDIVTKALEPAGLTVPAELAAIDTAGAKKLADDADSRLNEAAEQLTNVESGEGTPAMKTAAKVARLITLNSRIQLATVKGTLGDTGAKAAADQYRSDAEALKGDIAGTGGRLPGLPGSLGIAPAPAAPDAAPATPTPAPAAPVTPTPADAAPAAGGAQ